MKRLAGFLTAALTAFVIGTATAPPVQAAPAMTGTGTSVLDGTPQVTEEVGWRGGRRWGGPRYHRRAYFHRPHYRAYHRPIYRHHYRPYRPVYARPVYYGPSCFWRPARTVWTHYGWQWRPARRICRY
jgi:hypothetical protein